MSHGKANHAIAHRIVIMALHNTVAVKKRDFLSGAVDSRPAGGVKSAPQLGQRSLG